MSLNRPVRQPPDRAARVDACDTQVSELKGLPQVNTSASAVKNVVARRGQRRQIRVRLASIKAVGGDQYSRIAVSKYHVRRISITSHSRARRGEND